VFLTGGTELASPEVMPPPDQSGIIAVGDSRPINPETGLPYGKQPAPPKGPSPQSSRSSSPVTEGQTGPPNRDVVAAITTRGSSDEDGQPPDATQAATAEQKGDNVKREEE